MLHLLVQSDTDPQYKLDLILFFASGEYWLPDYFPRQTETIPGSLEAASEEYFIFVMYSAVRRCVQYIVEGMQMYTLYSPHQRRCIH